MKVVVQVRLFPDAVQEAALRETLDLCNEAVNVASAEAYRLRVFSKQALQRLTYGRLKAMGVPPTRQLHRLRSGQGRGGARPR